MNINHLDLQVPDVLATVQFFTRYFGFVQTSNPNSPSIAILTNEEEFVLVIQRDPDASYPKNFHLGFILPKEETVRFLQSRIKTERPETTGEVSVNARGVMFYCRTPGEILVECSYHPPRPPRSVE